MCGHRSRAHLQHGLLEESILMLDFLVGLHELNVALLERQARPRIRRRGRRRGRCHHSPQQRSPAFSVRAMCAVLLLAPLTDTIALSKKKRKKIKKRGGPSSTQDVFLFSSLGAQLAGRVARCRAGTSLLPTTFFLLRHLPSGRSHRVPRIGCASGLPTGSLAAWRDRSIRFGLTGRGGPSPRSRSPPPRPLKRRLDGG